MKLFKTLMIQPGETVYSEGDPAFDFYIIIEGEIELSTTPPTRLTHSEGSFFGERELFFSADRVKSDRAMVYSGAGRDAANDTAQATLHDLFGRHRHHTATVVSKTRCKLKFLRWDQLLHIVTMKQTKAQKDAGVPHPGPEIYKRIEHYAIQRHRAEERECGGDATAAHSRRRTRRTTAGSRRTQRRRCSGASGRCTNRSSGGVVARTCIARRRSKTSCGCKDVMVAQQAAPSLTAMAGKARRRLTVVGLARLVMEG